MRGCPECPRELKVIAKGSIRRTLGNRTFSSPTGPFALGCTQHGRCTDWHDAIPAPDGVPWRDVEVRTHEQQTIKDRAGARAATEAATLAEAQRPRRRPLTTRRQAVRAERSRSGTVIASTGLGAGKGRGSEDADA